MSRQIFGCSHSDSGAKTDDEDDGSSKFSWDSESEYAQPLTKLLKIKGQSATLQ